MAKIDTTKIEGYENMSAEEKLAILEGYEFDTSGMVSKATLDKATADAAEWKRKYNSTLSEAEQARIAAEEAQKATETRLAELERKDKISTTKDKYIASGFNAVLAQATAEAFVDGDMDAVLANVQKHVADAAKEKTDKDLKGTSAPPAGGNPNPGKIDYSEKISEAIALGNYADAAYYQRLQTQ
ncbi:MAG: hypothetical protein J6S14_11090 [Clostridia bacterium]|nr:hypothetical protein [Clostridia bacterium]